MARLTKDMWAKLRQDYEVTGMSLSGLSNKYGADRGNISKRAKKECWEKEKIQQIIKKKVSINKELENISAEITTLSTTGVVEIELEVDRRLRLENMFDSDVEHNQRGQTKKLKELEKMNKAELQHYAIHASTTLKNRDTILGKLPTTQVNIQQNNQGMTAPIIAIPAQETEESWQK